MIGRFLIAGYAACGLATSYMVYEVNNARSRYIVDQLFGLNNMNGDNYDRCAELKMDHDKLLNTEAKPSYLISNIFIWPLTLYRYENLIKNGKLI